MFWWVKQAADTAYNFQSIVSKQATELHNVCSVLLHVYRTYQPAFEERPILRILASSWKVFSFPRKDVRNHLMTSDFVWCHVSYTEALQ